MKLSHTVSNSIQSLQDGTWGDSKQTEAPAASELQSGGKEKEHRSNNKSAAITYQNNPKNCELVKYIPLYQIQWVYQCPWCLKKKKKMTSKSGPIFVCEFPFAAYPPAPRPGDPWSDVYPYSLLFPKPKWNQQHRALRVWLLPLSLTHLRLIPTVTRISSWFCYCWVVSHCTVHHFVYPLARWRT